MTSQTTLIPVFSGQLNPIDGEEVLLCDARKLHQFLQSKQDYSTWIKNRISEYGFVEDQDFLLHKFVEQKSGSGGHNRTDYHLTLDMAKELAMVERNEQGRAARRYFIECEKALQSKEYRRIATLSSEAANQVTLTDHSGYLDLSYLGFIKQELAAATSTLMSLYRPLNLLRSPETANVQQLQDALDTVKPLINYLISQRLPQ